MKVISIRRAILLTALTLLAQTGLAQRTLKAKITAVVDGDTIRIELDKAPVTVRLYGIDAPEFRQAFGAKSKQRLSNLIHGKVLRIVERSKSRDKNGRMIAEIFLEDGKCVNRLMVAEGCAWWYVKYASNEKSYQKLEDQARKARKGLWASKAPLPPWEFRKK